MDRRPLMTVVAGLSLAVAALAGVAVVAPDEAAPVHVPGVIARLDVRRDAPSGAAVGAAAGRVDAAPPTSTVVLPPLPSNTGPDATYDAPFVAAGDPGGGPTGEPPPTTVAGAPGVSIVGVFDTVSVIDDLGMIAVELPAAWGAVDTAPVGANPALAAAPDWDRWAEWAAPGVVIVAYPTIVDPEGVLAADPLTEHCRAGAISRFTERDHHGVQQIFTDCGGDHRVVNYVWIVSPPDLAYSLHVNVQLVGAADRAAFEVIRSTFDTVAGVVLPGDATPPAAGGFADDPADDPLDGPAGDPVDVPAGDPADDPGVVAPLDVPPAGYVTIRDNTGTLELAVPATWTQTNGASTRLDSGAWAPTLAASTDLRGLQARYDVPGVYVSRVELVGEPTRLLARYAAALDRDCDGSAGVESFASDGLFGVQQRWDDCGGTGYQFVVIVASPPAGDEPVDGSTLAMFVQLPAGESYTLDVLVQSLTILDGA